MFNASYADGRGRQTAYYQPAQGLFTRQGQPNYGFPPMIPQPGQQPGANPAEQSDKLMRSSGDQHWGQQSPYAMPIPPGQARQAFEQQQKLMAEAERKRQETLKKPETEAEKAKKTGAEAQAKWVDTQKQGPADKTKPKTQDAFAKPDPKATEGKGNEKANKEGWFKGSASTLIGAFKVTSALIITGGINAFFFGVPLKTASLVSGVVASSQALSALKIHKEDNDFTRKLIGFTRKLMGRENDHTPSGKEWSMVPVWGIICGLFGLSEAFFNHMSTKFSGEKPKTLNDRFKKLTEEVAGLKNVNGLSAWFRRMQLKNMERGRDLYVYLERKAGDFAGQKGNTLLKNAGSLAKSGLNWAKNFSEKSAGGKRPYLGYIWSFCMASLGGAAQTVIAALMQTKVDKVHGVK